MNIAIVRLSALGDIVQSQTVLQFIKKSYPDAQIDWFCDEDFVEILRENPLINNVIPLQIKDLKRSFSFSKLLKIISVIRSYNGRYDYIIDLQGLIKSAIVTRLLGKNSYGYDKDSLRESQASYFYKYKFKIDYKLNVITRYCELVSKALKIKITPYQIENKDKVLHYATKDIEKYIQKDSKNTLFILGASWKSKIYPPSKMANISLGLDSHSIVVWGNEEDRLLSDVFYKVNPQATICDKLDLQSLMALIDRCDLVIGPDTGPTHIAWALNRPVITIFGVTPSFRNAYKSKTSLIVDTGKKVDPFNLEKNRSEITSIPEHKIIKLAKGLLGR